MNMKIGNGPYFTLDEKIMRSVVFSFFGLFILYLRTDKGRYMGLFTGKPEWMVGKKFDYKLK